MKILLVILGVIFIFLFLTWVSSRNSLPPSLITVADCQRESQNTARDLLKTKSEIDPRLEKYVTKGLILKKDYDYAYEKCLEREGLKGLK